MYSNYCGQHHQQHPVRAPGSWLLTRGKFTSHLVSIHGGDDPGPGEPRQRRAAGPGQPASPRVGSGRSIERSKRAGHPRARRGWRAGQRCAACGQQRTAGVLLPMPEVQRRGRIPRAARGGSGAPRRGKTCPKSEGMQGGNGINIDGTTIEGLQGAMCQPRRTRRPLRGPRARRATRAVFPGGNGRVSWGSWAVSWG
jgi:hypothetical protein